MAAQFVGGIPPAPDDQRRGVRRLLGTQSRTLLDPFSRHPSRLGPVASLGTKVASRFTPAISTWWVLGADAPNLGAYLAQPLV
jgi:hypothetical protein